MHYGCIVLRFNKIHSKMPEMISNVKGAFILVREAALHFVNQRTETLLI